MESCISVQYRKIMQSYVSTDAKGVAVKNEHNHESNEKKVEVKNSAYV